MQYRRQNPHFTPSEIAQIRTFDLHQGLLDVTERLTQWTAGNALRHRDCNRHGQIRRVLSQRLQPTRENRVSIVRHDGGWLS